MRHLAKAKAALEHAKEMDPGDPTTRGTYEDLIQIASVQAQVAQAAALERIADKLDEPVRCLTRHG